MTNTHRVSVMSLDTNIPLYTGTPKDISRFINMPELAVCGYAEWGRPAKKLKKLGYYLRWVPITTGDTQ